MTIEGTDGGIESISAVTLATQSMVKSVVFYRSLGFELASGGPQAEFTTFRVGGQYLNIIATSDDPSWWGRVIFWVSDVDRMYRRALEAGRSPEAPPRDADWGERYFHLRDPDGHELSFARRLAE
jgi:catechol 2,3-dioxygenase-like lactoylglutathione lyase family enzyme